MLSFNNQYILFTTNPDPDSFLTLGGSVSSDIMTILQILNKILTPSSCEDWLLFQQPAKYLTRPPQRRTRATRSLAFAGAAAWPGLGLPNSDSSPWLAFSYERRVSSLVSSL